VRYGLVLRETGTLLDDGTVVMTAPDRILLATTSGNAGRVTRWLQEWHQCEWPELRVAIVPVTECWATISVAGALARSVLSKFPSSIDFSPEAFPHLSMRERTLMGLRTRIYRVSFSGELTYEINVPSDRGSALWQALRFAGGFEGLEPFGMDALMLMRMEKGFLHLGSDTEGPRSRTMSDLARSPRISAETSSGSARCNSPITLDPIGCNSSGSELRQGPRPLSSAVICACATRRRSPMAG
jgi:sarcosine oxidase, subunit alpha